MYSYGLVHNRDQNNIKLNLVLIFCRWEPKKKQNVEITLLIRELKKNKNTIKAQKKCTTLETGNLLSLLVNHATNK